ncbi:MAG: hypothetical protein IPM88_06055 [Nitrospira sp.]|nr:hypothetical protein [Nitrospira sp.]
MNNSHLEAGLSMRAVGKNVESLREYKAIYERHCAGLRHEVDIAKERIAELIPEATVPKELKPEFAELKEEVIRLGGTKKIRELLAAQEDTNRQAFVQNRGSSSRRRRGWRPIRCFARCGSTS